MPKIITRTLVLLVLLAMFPPLLVARARALNSDLPRVHLIQDMDNQAKFRAQHANEMFADGRAMRPHPEGTVARGSLNDDPHFYLGMVNGEWATTFPSSLPLNTALLARGEARFNIYCAPCHGESGDGRGQVAVRAADLRNLGTAPTWVDPKPVYDPVTLTRPVGQLFAIISNGINTMPAYAAQIPEDDRWAIVAWVKALQRGQHASWDDLPADERDRLQDKREDAIRAAAEEAAREAREAAERAARAAGTNRPTEGSGN